MPNLPALKPLQALSIGSLPSQRAQTARSILARPTTRTEALRQAKRLTGSFSNLRAPDPEQFAEAVADVLEQYPLGLVEECCDARIGLARKVEFLSIKSLADWLDQRGAHYAALSRWQPPRLAALPPPDPEPGAAKRVSAAIRGLVRTMLAGGDVRGLTFAVAAEVGEDDDRKRANEGEAA